MLFLHILQSIPGLSYLRKYPREKCRKWCNYILRVCATLKSTCSSQCQGWNRAGRGTQIHHHLCPHFIINSWFPFQLVTPELWSCAKSSLTGKWGNWHCWLWTSWTSVSSKANTEENSGIGYGVMLTPAWRRWLDSPELEEPASCCLLFTSYAKPAAIRGPVNRFPVGSTATFPFLRTSQSDRVGSNPKRGATLSTYTQNRRREG